MTNEVDGFNEALGKGEGSSIPAVGIRGLLGRGHCDLVSCQVFLNSVQQFQEKLKMHAVN